MHYRDATWRNNGRVWVLVNGGWISDQAAATALVGDWTGTFTETQWEGENNEPGEPVTSAKSFRVLRSGNQLVVDGDPYFGVESKKVPLSQKPNGVFVFEHSDRGQFTRTYRLEGDTLLVTEALDRRHGYGATGIYKRVSPGVSKSGGCDETSCVLANYEGTCCATFRASSPPPLAVNGPTNPPPALRDERPDPRPGFIWARGRYEWRNNSSYEWVPGHWERERGNRRWSDGRWEKRGTVWVYIPGGWS